jgi:hypothetical protein
MMNRILILLILVTLGSCLSEEVSKEEKTDAPSEIKIEAAGTFASSPFQEILNISPDTTIIFSNQENTIEGSGNLKIVIPAYSFVDKEGKCPEEVKITHFIADNISRMLSSNLTTEDISGNVLSSNGMFYLDARTKDGQQLAISEESGISILVKSEILDEDYSMYKGTADGEKITWTAENTPSETLLSFKASNIYSDDYWMNIPKEYHSLNDPKYDYSNIATLAIRDRLRASEDCANYLNWLNEGFDLNAPAPDIMNIYIENIEKPIYYSDSLVAVHIENALNTCLDTKESCSHERDIRYFIALYKSFARQKIGNPFDFAPYMEALKSDSPLESLLSQGLSKSKSSFILTLYKRQELLSANLAENAKIRNANNNFQLNRLGWGNIDKLYKLGNLKYTKIFASISDYDETIKYKTYLLIPRFKVLINLREQGGEIKVNDKKEQYGLSIYDEAKLVVLGIKKDKLFFGDAKFNPGKNQQLNIKMKSMTAEDFELKLQGYN